MDTGGGGFMPGESNSPAGARSEAVATVRPVTIKQILDATQSYAGASYQIDGTDVDKIFVVGQVRNISAQSTKITFKIEDGTGEIEVQQFINMDDNMDIDGSNPTAVPLGKSQVQLNGYARFFGRVVTTGNRRNVFSNFARPVTTVNEVHHHFLEATAIHLYFTRGPPQKPGQNPSRVEAGSSGAGMGVTDDYGAAAKGRPLPPMSPGARKVYNLLKSEPQSNEGLHVQYIAAKLGVPVTEVVKAGDELLTESVIFITVDENTWAIMEYY
jgi:replication factor A2